MNIPSTSEHSPDPKRFGFWGNLRLPLKLMLAFSVVFVFALLIAGITLWGMQQVTTAYEDTLTQGVEIRSISDHLTSSLLQARRAEKNFILRWQSEGFYTAYENYVTLNPRDITSARGPTYLQNVVAIRESIKQLAPFGLEAESVSTGDMTQTQYETDLALLGQYVDTYEQSFIAIAEAYQRKGFDEDTDFESEFRSAARNIEAKIFGQAGLEKLMITFLVIRTSEKNYLADAEPSYAVEIYTYMPLLETQIAETDILDPAVKTELLTQTEAYLTAFGDLVALDQEIDARNEELINAARAVESLTAKFELLGEQLATDDVNRAHTNNTRTFTVSITTVVIVLALTIFMSIILSRQITRPVKSLTNTAERIALGNYGVQAEVSSGDEFGTLANTFNSMTGQLSATLTNLEKRTQNLATVARISTTTATILDPFEMLATVVHLTQRGFNLYHAHVFTYHEDLGKLQIVACGYKEGDEHEGTHGTASIPLGQEQSLVARAGRTRRPVIVNDVRSDPGWLPNPLLPDTRAELAVPLLVGDELLGVLDVQSEYLNAFTDEDANIQMTLAAQIATALKNAQSYDEAHKRAELETMINAIGQKILHTTTVEDTLQTAIREIGLALGASRVSARIAGHQDGGNATVSNYSGQFVED